MQTNKLPDHEKRLHEWSRGAKLFHNYFTHHLAISGVAIAGRRWRHRFKGQRADEEAHSEEMAE